MNTYEKKYKEALERAREEWTNNLDNAYSNYRERLEIIFPELKESEDERIRKWIIDDIRYNMNNEPLNNSEYKKKAEKAIAWLEKQAEQKEYTFKSLPRLLEMIEPTERAKAYCQKLIDALIKEGYATDAKIVGECLKQMNGEKVALATMDENQGEQQQKWTEEDDYYRDNLIKWLNCGAVRVDLRKDFIDWLNSLKQRMEE